MPSVIIPAHNEEASIVRCLESILRDGIDDLEVTVVANGCTDQTVARARSVHEQVTVLDVATAGKANALNVGDRSTRSFPRAYVDGDIELEEGALKATFDALSEKIHLASPPPRFDMNGSSWMVRSFYNALAFHPYFGAGSPNGSGVYVVSRAGRQRWSEFPGLIADDGFVESHFDETEKLTAAGPSAIVQTPRTTSALIHIQARSRQGTRELQQYVPSRQGGGQCAMRVLLPRLLASPFRWGMAFAYLYIRAAEYAYLLVRKRRTESSWLRDNTSRQRLAAETPRSAA